jgi:hypothetical protein
VGPARIEIKLLEGDVVVHEFTRSTTMHRPDSIKHMLETALGWIQAYQGQVSNEQFLKDAKRVRSLVD